MTKTDLVKALAKAEMESLSLTNKQAQEVIDTLIEVITDGLKEDNVVQITNFGTFKAKEVPEHEGHNPKNPSEKITIPARIQVSFSSGNGLKENLNNPTKKVKKIIKKK
jgi:DNA-binding protein HU-beta